MGAGREGRWRERRWHHTRARTAKPRERGKRSWLQEARKKSKGRTVGRERATDGSKGNGRGTRVQVKHCDWEGKARQRAEDIGPPSAGRGRFPPRLDLHEID